MSINLKTLVIDGEGTEAKMIVANSQDDYAHLHMLAMLGFQNWVNPPLNIVDLIAVLEKNTPIPPGPKEAVTKLTVIQKRREENHD